MKKKENAMTFFFSLSLLYLLAFTREYKKCTMKTGKKIMFFKTEDRTTGHLSAREWIGRKIFFPFLYHTCPKKGFIKSQVKPLLLESRKGPQCPKECGGDPHYSVSFLS